MGSQGCVCQAPGRTAGGERAKLHLRPQPPPAPASPPRPRLGPPGEEHRSLRPQGLGTAVEHVEGRKRCMFQSGQGGTPGPRLGPPADLSPWRSPWDLPTLARQVPGPSAPHALHPTWLLALSQPGDPSVAIYPWARPGAWSPGEGTQPSGPGGSRPASLWPGPLAGPRAGPAAALGRPAVAAGDSAGGMWGIPPAANTWPLAPLPHRCQEALLLRPSLRPPGTTRAPRRVWALDSRVSDRGLTQISPARGGEQFPLKTVALGPSPGRDCGADARAPRGLRVRGS